jgi:hypothetical protein
MKVYSYKQAVMDTYNHPEFLEGFTPEHHVHLGDADGRSYYSFDSDFVKLAENDEEKYDVKVYDSKKKADKEHLASVVNSLHFLRQVIIVKKAALFDTIDMFDVLSGIAEQDKYVLDKIKTVKKDVEDTLANYGF